MNAMNAATTVATNASTTEPIGELLSHLWRAKYLSGAVEDTFESLLAHVELADKPARLLGNRLHVFLELLDAEISLADGYALLADGTVSWTATSSVGRHVDIQRARDWGIALAEWQAAKAVSSPENCGDNDFTQSIDARTAALFKFLETPSPHLRALHEKLIELGKFEGWELNGTPDAILADVEQLARRFEIAVQDAAPASENPPDWQAALDEYNCARLVEKAHPQASARVDDPLYEALRQDNIRVFNRVQDALLAVMQMPAPNTEATADKLQILVDYYDDADTDLLGHIKSIVADIRDMNRGG